MISFPLIACLSGFITLAVTCNSPLGLNNPDKKPDGNHYRVMFYNVENFFDTVDDSVTTDEAYTPSGQLHWTSNRYYHKINNISKVIIAVGGWEPPDIIGLCEVENREVLEDLLNSASLSKFPYAAIHEESRDKRGIDVALLYNKERIRHISSKPITINKKGLATRDILYFKALVGNDTCHFFVNHWPSRSAGQLETEKDRFAAARTLRHHCDSIFGFNDQAKIVIMGDFNDDPDDVSITEKLFVKGKDDELQPGTLYNLTEPPSSGSIRGTLKYEGYWNIFDQIIVSGNMLENKTGIVLKNNSFNILQNTFLLETDRKYNGYKPYRTYSGFKYQGGFSDHLPVFIDLFVR